jgi:transcription elongation factor Elf1
MIRTSEETFGVPACQVLGSRNTALPMGSGQGVLSCIHCGSSASDGMGAVQ